MNLVDNEETFVSVQDRLLGVKIEDITPPRSRVDENAWIDKRPEA